ncbi:amidase signature domain-containing protein [Mucor mucedo]|uniref:amidase signature domain-containing protein n=1 Tax=Mucor mucedo TaxID=29922 RepID=UPI00221EE8A0|nr:amidase signature domain-containing protein [Mucor mucedo]KAI7895174.1 amidase signature domain-containing protein [Mucor mucedo]
MLSRTVRISARQWQQCRYSSTVALKECLSAIDAYNSEINAFTSINDRALLHKKALESDARKTNGTLKSELDGTTIAIKDNFCTTFLPTTCASIMLKDFTSPYDATVVKLLDDAGALIMGKTNMDEFGMGSANIHSAFGPVINPCSHGDEIKRSAGGSSGGSAASVAMNMCTAALGSDTGGSVRMPASYCGLVGFKPSYGRCSRHGLVAYANSLDTVGILTRNVQDCSKVYDIISNYDIQDPTSIPNELRTELDANDTQLSLQFQNDLKGLVVGVPQEFYVDSLSDEVLDVWRKGIQHLESLGAKIISVSIPHVSLALPAYYIIALAEASSNLARYDGIRYGHRSPDNEDHLLYEETRSSGFGDEVKKRILLGTHVLTAGTYETLFLPAQSARRLIQKEFNGVFKQPNLLYNENTQEGERAHILLVPSATSEAPTLNNKKSGIDEYINDVMTLPANLAGIPAITVPFRNTPNPIGLQLMGQYGYDQFLLRVADIMTSKKSPI